MPLVYGSSQPTRCRLIVCWEPSGRINGSQAAFQAGQNGNHAGLQTYNSNAVLMPKEGYVTSIGTRIYTAGPSGTHTSQIYKNGSAVAGTSINTTSSQLNNTTFASTVCPFVFGDSISVFFSTANWSQTSGGIYVEVWGYI